MRQLLETLKADIIDALYEVAIIQERLLRGETIQIKGITKTQPHLDLDDEKELIDINLKGTMKPIEGPVSVADVLVELTAEFNKDDGELSNLKINTVTIKE